MICTKKWSLSDIANELMNNDCPPPQTRHALINYIKYTIKARRRSESLDIYFWLSLRHGKKSPPQYESIISPVRRVRDLKV
jgi:hypothetical protein